MNSQELSAVGEPIGFQVTLVNAGSKTADGLRIRVVVPRKLEAVDSADYQVQDGQIEFPLQKLASGEKVTLAFQAIGREVGEHRVRVLVDGIDLTKELAYEGFAFCYSETESTERTTQTNSRRRTAALPRYIQSR